VIQAAGADVIRPPVSADDPHAASYEVFEHAAQVVGRRSVHPLEPALQLGDAFALRAQLRLPQLRRREDLVHQVCAERLPQFG
jgi:hypothetical protein